MTFNASTCLEVILVAYLIVVLVQGGYKVGEKRVFQAFPEP